MIMALTPGPPDPDRPAPSLQNTDTDRLLDRVHEYLAALVVTGHSIADPVEILAVQMVGVILGKVAGADLPRVYQDLFETVDLCNLDEIRRMFYDSKAFDDDFYPQA